jgi:hypothetical protein
MFDVVNKIQPIEPKKRPNSAQIKKEVKGKITVNKYIFYLN